MSRFHLCITDADDPRNRIRHSNPTCIDRTNHMKRKRDMAFRPPTAHEKGDGSNTADGENRRQREQLRLAALLQQRRRRLIDAAAPIHLDLPSAVPEFVKGTHGARGVTVGAASPSYGITRPSSHALARRGGHVRERRLRGSKSHSRSPPPALAPVDRAAPLRCGCQKRLGTVGAFLVVRQGELRVRLSPQLTFSYHSEFGSPYAFESGSLK
ncbi:hypothetical protein GW17_00037221 [Ensete ventricosum]|nr:hypothetical protein GW17_00037221 [Ensete ventricosum]RZS10986.1 hypothetical protein BHM03_00042276 [Ensete ventricosum]